MSESRPPDDTPPDDFWIYEEPDMPKPVAPDDTPTFPDEGRITEVFVNGQKIYLPFDGVLVKKGDVIEVVGGVDGYGKLRPKSPVSSRRTPS